MRASGVDKAIYFKVVVSVFTLIFLMVGGFLVLQQWEDNRWNTNPNELGKPTIEYNGAEYVQKSNIETFLIMGLDKSKGGYHSDSYRNDAQADFLLLFV